MNIRDWKLEDNFSGDILNLKIGHQLLVNAEQLNYSFIDPIVECLA